MRQDQIYRELFENAGDLVFSHDLEGRLTSLNRAGEQLTGYTRAEAIGKNVADVVAPKYLSSVRNLAGKQPLTSIVDLVTKDGRRVPVEISSWLICQGGRPVAVQSIGRDI